ncbi:MAG: glycosyltransferase family 2 protein [Candidatus Bipolaricaulota bacterium]|nr:glycosyltransferase family 2 protein [Candidatus Bipolaricaulota bacterium]MDW8151901.1 glycosyltransferase family 2 protein [Candidatus Bipolaricaulota bacterium]
MSPSLLSLACGLGLGLLLALLGRWRNARTRRTALAHTAPPRPLSIVIASRNEEAVIENTVRSLAQAAPDAEIVVVDASTDRTPQILTELRREFPQLVVLDDPYRRGKPAALNHALRHARGEILLFLDADARMGPEALRFYHALASHPANPVVFADFAPYNRRRTFAVVLQELFFAMAKAFVFSGLFWRPVFMTCGLFVRREALEKAGEFDPNTLVDDFDLGTRLAQHGITAKFVRGPLCLIQYAPTLPDLFAQFLRWYTGGIREMFEEIRRGRLSYLGLMALLAWLIYLPWFALWVDLGLGTWVLLRYLVPGALGALYGAVLLAYWLERPRPREALLNALGGPLLLHLWLQAAVLVSFFRALGRGSTWYKVRRERA